SAEHERRSVRSDIDESVLRANRSHEAIASRNETRAGGLAKGEDPFPLRRRSFHPRTILGNGGCDASIARLSSRSPDLSRSLRLRSSRPFGGLCLGEQARLR